MRAWTLKARSGNSVTVNAGNFVDGPAVSVYVKSIMATPISSGLAMLTAREAERVGDAIRTASLRLRAAKAKRPRGGR